MATTALLRLADDAVSYASSSLTARSWGPLVSVSRTSVTALLKRLQHGQLEIRTPTGVWRFGDPTLVKAKEHGAHLRPSDGSHAATAPADVVNALNAPPTHVADDPKAAAAALATMAAAAAAAKAPAPASGAPHAVLIVHSDNFWVRMFLGADLGFAESYMLGEVDTPDLGACFEVRAAPVPSACPTHARMQATLTLPRCCSSSSTTARPSRSCRAAC